ncbi:UGT80A2 [Symbiodinium sp. CCMP2592]|nr:UGT80A2 [Symbiodinium sp. CCMP2592]
MPTPGRSPRWPAEMLALALLLCGFGLSAEAFICPALLAPRSSVGVAKTASFAGRPGRFSGKEASSVSPLFLAAALGAASCLARAARGRAAVEEALGAQLTAPASDASEQRILVVAMGTRGDAEPGFRLAAALRDRGHAVLVVSLDAYKAEATQRFGLDFRSSGLESVPLSQDYLTGKTRADQVYADRGWYGDAWTTVGEKIYEAAQEHQCDLIVTTSMGNTHCLDVAEKLNILCFALKFCPDIDGQVPTADFPPSGYPSGPGFMNLLFHVLENLNTVRAVFQGGFIPRVIDFRNKLGLPSQEIPGVMEVPTYSDYRQTLQANQPSLYAFSSALIDRPSEYQSWHFVTGSFSARGGGYDPTSPELPADLLKFLKKGETVCIAFGSMSLARTNPFEERAVASVRRQGRQVLIVDKDTPQEGLGDDGATFRIKSAPYDRLFPLCALVVHHGGAGTLQDCLFAGTPQLVAPVLSWSDQPLWGKVVEEKSLGLCLGAGGVPPSAAEWDAALEEVLGRLPAFRKAAEEVAPKASGEEGLEAACQILEESMA